MGRRRSGGGRSRWVGEGVWFGEVDIRRMVRALWNEG